MCFNLRTSSACEPDEGHMYVLQKLFIWQVLLEIRCLHAAWSRWACARNADSDSSPCCRGHPLWAKYLSLRAGWHAQTSPAAGLPPFSGTSVVSPRLPGSLLDLTVTFFQAPPPVSPNSSTLCELPLSLSCWPRASPSGFPSPSQHSSFPPPGRLTPEGDKSATKSRSTQWCQIFKINPGG